MSDFQLPDIQTNFLDNNGVDLGKKLITKDYLISVYPSIATQLGIPPELWIWGNNANRQLGTNVTSTSVATPVTTFSGGINWKQVSLGYRHAAAIKTDGTLWVWGNNTSGQLGDNSTITRSTPVTTLIGGNNWKQVSCGRFVTGAIKTDGSLWVWGNGNGFTPFIRPVSSIPINVFGGGTTWADTATGAAEELYTLSAGNSHTAALKTDGTLWVWGSTADGRLGDNSSSGNDSTPVTTFVGGTNWKDISAGQSHTAAIKADGTLWVWGNGSNGQLGVHPLYDRYTPVTTFAGGTNWADTATGAAEELYTVSFGYSFVSAVKTDGTLWVWGNNVGRQLGINSVSTGVSTPVTTFAGGTNWKQVSTGYRHATAIKTDGTLWSWGNNSVGQLGTNDTNSRSTPVTTFTGGTNWKQISSGRFHNGAIKTDGTLWVWGNNVNLQLGNKDFLSIKTPVTTFAGGNNWADTATGAAEELYTLSANSLHAAAIKTDGTLWIWGFGASARLGNFAIANRSTPVTTFAGGTDWKQVSLGGFHSAAIKTDGTLWTWGSNVYGRLGNFSTTDRSTPVTTFAGGTDWKQVSSGGYHTAAIKTDGTLWIWGTSTNARLGTNDIINRSTPVTTFAGGTNWKQISLGAFHTTAIKTDGTLWTWGNNASSQLGINDTNTRSTPVTTFAGGTDWKQVSAGLDCTSAIKTDGTLWVWGNNSSMQLGTNTTIIQSTPVTTFSGGTNWKQVSSGRRNSSAIKTDGTLWCWGVNTYGSLGTNDYENKSTPVTTFIGGTDWKQVSSASHYNSNGTGTGGDLTIALKGSELYVFGNPRQLLSGTNFETFIKVPSSLSGTTWKQISCGNSFTGSIKTDGTLWVWGNNSLVQLGTNDAITKSTPVTTFAGGTDWKQVSSGGYHTAAIKTDGTLWVWGNNSFRELGSNSAAANVSTPVTTFAGGTTWKQASAGNGFTAAVKTDGTLWAWGNNAEGQLGNDLLVNFSTPITTFAGGTNWTQVNVSGISRNTSAIKTDGTLWVWGNNAFRQLGSRPEFRFIPDQVFGGSSNWKQVSSGAVVTAAIKTDGTLWTWGAATNRQLGFITTTTRSTPVTTFAGGTDWKQVSCGSNHIASIKTDGTLWVWGSNTYGRLGTIDAITKSTPVTTFVGGIDWKQVSVGDYHTAAIKTDGTLWVWGLGSTLGTNDVSNRLTPVTTFAGGTNWKQVSAGYRHIAAVKTDGTLWTWGRNTSGQLGINIGITESLTPVTTFIGGTNWRQVNTGYQYTIALKGDGVNNELYVWGNNNQTQLGVGYYNNLLQQSEVFGDNTSWNYVNIDPGLYPSISAIKTDGTLWTWGNGSFGQLGTNDQIDRSTPVTTFVGGSNWKQVSLGWEHTSALKTDGTLWTWGNGFLGQLGLSLFKDSRETPVTTFSGGTNWANTATGAAEELYTISAGYRRSSALKTDGTLWTWGGGPHADNDPGAPNKSTPITTFTGGTTWKQISSSFEYTAAIKTDGTLWLWGFNTDGRLGINSVGSANTPVTTFAGGTDWKQVSLGDRHTAAIKTDGTLWVWGNGRVGQLGINTKPNQVLTPVTTFIGGTTWKQVSSGITHTAAIKTDGTLWTWGDGGLGRNGNETAVSTPVTTFAGGINWSDTATGAAEELYTLSAGYSNTSAVKTDGTLWTWGYNSLAQLGINSTGDRSTPVTTFAGGTNWKQVSNFGYHTAAVKTDGTLWVWGFNLNGQLGDNSTTNRSTPVTTFIGGITWKQASAGYKHTAAVKTDGTLWAWGNGSSGRLGILFRYTELTPVTTFAGGNNWADTATGVAEELYTITSGSYHSAAIKTDGTLWVWGNNGNGALGDASITIKSTPVTTFAGGTDWKQVSASSWHTAAIKTDGTLWTWGGAGSGQLGTNDINIRSTPVTTFAGGTNWKQVSCGFFHMSAIKTDGTLWLWGLNSNGQLGTIDLVLRFTPVTTFAGGTDWKQVSSGDRHTAAIKTDGTLWVWGNGSQGVLGINDTIDRATPVTTFAGGTNWKQVSSGQYLHTAAIKTDGTLWIWGNSFSNSDSSIPVDSGITAIATSTSIISGTSGFNAFPNTGKRITTNGTTGTVTTITPNLLGAAALTESQTPTVGNNDDGYWSLTLPFSISYDGVSYSDIYVGTNFYITFTTGSTTYGSISVSNPSLPKIMISSADNSAQRIYYGTEGTSPNRTYRVRLEGNSNTTGTLGSPTMVYEAIFYEASPSQFDIQIGVNSRASTQVVPTYTPVTTFVGGTNWKQVSAGYKFTQAVKTDGTLWTWGYNSLGQLGINATGDRSTPVTTFAGGTNWRQAHAGSYDTSIAIRGNGINNELYVWGNNNLGQLGINFKEDINSVKDPRQVLGNNWKHVSAGYRSTGAIKTDGTLWTWGRNDFGQLGNNSLTTISTPVTTFAGGNDWKQVSCGTNHMTSIKTDGTLWVWGSNIDGQLGTNDNIDRSTPVTTFAGGTNWKQVSCAFLHTAAVKTDGTLWVWGNSYQGRLGTNDNINRSTPVTTFAGGTTWKQVSCGQKYTIALKDNGINKELYAWGNNFTGQLGFLNEREGIPITTFAGGTTWKQVSSGYRHTTAVKTDGTLWTWGYNSYGKLGTNDTANRSTPVTTFAGGINWKQVSCSFFHIAAVKTDGTLWTWGGAGSWQLGTNDTNSRSTPVTTFAGGTNWTQVSAAKFHNLALKNTGELYGWGTDFRFELGIARPSEVLVPNKLDGTTWKQTSSGRNYTAAIKTDGTLWLWGSDGYSKLGINSILTTVQTPVTTFAGGTNWKQVSLGEDHTVALKTDGTLWTWGSSATGQLGNFSFATRSTPVTTFAGGTNWKQVFAGKNYTGGLKSTEY